MVNALITLLIFCTPAPLLAANLQLRVLTYNIWGLPSPKAHATWRYGEIAKRLGAYDVIAFEEAWSSNTDVVWQIPTHPYHAFGGQVHGMGGASGLILASKYPIVESHFLGFTICAGWECLAKKGVLMTRIQISPGLQVDFYMTHLNAWDEHELIRSSQIMELVGMINDYSLDNPIVIMGDLNAGFRSNNYWELLGGVGALRDSYLDYVSTLHSPTQEQVDGYSFDVVKNPWAATELSEEKTPQRLDYIFYRDSAVARLRVRESKLVFTEPVQGNKPLSDHYGLTTVFDVSRPLRLDRTVIERDSRTREQLAVD